MHEAGPWPKVALWKHKVPARMEPTRNAHRFAYNPCGVANFLLDAVPSSHLSGLNKSASSPHISLDLVYKLDLAAWETECRHGLPVIPINGDKNSLSWPNGYVAQHSAIGPANGVGDRYHIFVATLPYASIKCRVISKCFLCEEPDLSGLESSSNISQSTYFDHGQSVRHSIQIRQ
jgi:hypothetical protein